MWQLCWPHKYRELNVANNQRSKERKLNKEEGNNTIYSQHLI